MKVGDIKHYKSQFSRPRLSTMTWRWLSWPHLAIYNFSCSLYEYSISLWQSRSCLTFQRNENTAARHSQEVLCPSKPSFTQSASPNPAIVSSCDSKCSLYPPDCKSVIKSLCMPVIILTRYSCPSHGYGPFYAVTKTSRLPSSLNPCVWSHFWPTPLFPDRVVTVSFFQQLRT